LFLTIAGDITQKGYEKKRMKLLSPYLSSQKAAGLYTVFFAVLFITSLFDCCWCHQCRWTTDLFRSTMLFAQ